MYCKHCGKINEDDAKFCTGCGAKLERENYSDNYSYSSNEPPKRPVNPAPYVEPDAPSTGFAILSFFFPVIGLILYLVWKDQTPLKANSCGKGALIGVIVSVVISALGGSCYMALLDELINGGYFY